MTVLPVLMWMLATFMLSVRMPSRLPAPSPPMSRKLTRSRPPQGSSALIGVAAESSGVLGKISLTVSLAVSTVLAVSAKGVITATHSTPTTMPETTWPAPLSRLGPSVM
ncbi:hypothetical protein Psi01_68420 [Planobispora siamensis]|uniref:Uncharacterized protein n=1 Tax=Planobispora siamensis TaxID=936338 RepID=A0A8J3WPY1_9ACTN|nr:hypothetical protein [Planobispora siamensis]GIH96212.1 hypothetical protein Psi01_68420 [Planobispora siamensis]